MIRGYLRKMIQDLEEARQASGLSHLEIWIRYMGLGGTQSRNLFKKHISEGFPPGDDQRNLAALAFNEFFSEIGQNHPVAYIDDSGAAASA